MHILRKKNIVPLLFGFFLLGNLGVSSAIIIQIPDQQGQPDVAVTGPTQIEGDESDVFSTINMINTYLWFSIGAICMGVLVYGGITLITAQGNADKMKKTNKILLGALFGIFIAVFSYVLIRLLVNLFE